MTGLPISDVELFDLEQAIAIGGPIDRLISATGKLVLRIREQEARIAALKATIADLELTNENLQLDAEAYRDRQG